MLIYRDTLANIHDLTEQKRFRYSCCFQGGPVLCLGKAAALGLINQDRFKLTQQASQCRKQTTQGWLSCENTLSWLSWLLPFLGPFVSLFLLLFTGPFIINSLTKFLSSCLQAINLQMILQHGFQLILFFFSVPLSLVGKTSIEFYSSTQLDPIVSPEPFS